MILEALWWEKRAVLAYDDIKGFIRKNDNLRNKLESLCNTKIFTFQEFMKWIKQI